MSSSSDVVSWRDNSGNGHDINDDQPANRSISEIIEEDDDDFSSRDVPDEIEELFEIKKFLPMPSIKEELSEIERGSTFTSIEENDNVYVGVGKTESSMDALVWTLKHAINRSSSSFMVYLVHIYPEIRYIPTPYCLVVNDIVGKLPVSQVNPEHVEKYKALEKAKTREFLQKFIATCSANKVKVDTVLIESDSVAKAMLDLICILNIKQLVLGTTKSKARKLRSRRSGGSGIVEQLVKNAPETCKIKIICEQNKVVIDNKIDFTDNSKSTQEDVQLQHRDSSSWICFKAKSA